MKNTGFGYKSVAFGIVCFICVVLLYQYNDSKKQLINLEFEETQCKQKKESLAAQLQVVYEHKSRLEKSLQKEKDDNINAKEKFEADLKSANEAGENAKLDLQNKLNTVNEEMKMLKNKHDDLQQQFSSLQQQLNQIKDDKLKAEMKCDENFEKTKQDLVNAAAENSQLTKDIKRLEAANSEADGLRLKIAQLEDELSSCRGSVRDSAHLEVPQKRAETAVAPLSRLLSNAGSQDQPEAKPREQAAQQEHAVPPFHQAPTSNLSSPNAAALHFSQQDGAKLTYREPPAVGQIPVPKDEHQIREAQAGLPDTGRVDEVVQAQQVPIPKNPQRILAEEAGVVPRSAENEPATASAKLLPMVPPVAQPGFVQAQQDVPNAREEQPKSILNAREQNRPSDNVEAVVGKPESNAAKEKLDESDFNNAAESDNAAVKVQPQ